MKNKITIALFLSAIIIASTFSAAAIETNVERNDTSFTKDSEFTNLETTTFDSSSKPTAIVVSDSNPFYPLIVNSIAVNYNETGSQEIIPLYVLNFEDPSSATVKTMMNVNKNSNLLIIDELLTLKQRSLWLADYFWDESDSVLLIEENQDGYNLGVMAAPIASYLNIPIIVTDIVDTDVTDLLSDLGVTNSYICGEIDGYGDEYRFADVYDIINVTVDIIKSKFGDVDYITITNPIDAKTITPLETETYVYESDVEGFSTLRLKDAAKMMLKDGGLTIDLGNFTIPSDYKYCLVKLEGINYNVEGVDKYGDYVGFKIKSDKGKIVSTDTAGGVPVRNSNGEIIEDRCYTEAVFYDYGGTECTVYATNPMYAVDKDGSVQVTVTIEKLEDPIYPMMKSFSSMAPYLTSYHKGIIFGKPEFAFAADDDVLGEGEPSPGFYMPRINKVLRNASNEHVYGIHEQINEVLANLAEIPVENLSELREHYNESPVYIALVGGATVLPQMSYDNIVFQPTNSDYIYGNIDPKKEWINTANDTYTFYPCQENIVGRIIAWDTQDESALIARTIFYDEVLKSYTSWKNNSAVLVGCCNDFQKNSMYRVIDFISRLTGVQIISRGEPLKWWNGYGEISAKRVGATVFEPMGFESDLALYFEAMRKGISKDAIDELKYDTNLLNKLLLNKKHLEAVDENHVRGQELLEDSNYIFFNAHGSSNLFTAGDVAFSGLGYGHFIIPFFTQLIARTAHIGPFLSLSAHTMYNIRGIEGMDMGPSVMFLESCICGQIDGHHPKTIVSPTFVHAGLNTLVAASITSNVGGGYLEPKNKMYDSFFSNLRAYITNRLNAKKGEYPDPHFGYLIHADMCNYLAEDYSVGYALRLARNGYLEKDVNWTLWWAPPLDENAEDNPEAENLGLFDKEEKQILMEHKYTAFQEYQLYGDPAFNPYEPVNSD